MHTLFFFHQQIRKTRRAFVEAQRVLRRGVVGAGALHGAGGRTGRGARAAVGAGRHEGPGQVTR